jgi:aspartate/methionine/tyrosine aminotransferase
MSNLLLAIPKLGEGWLDLSVGEAHIVRNALLTTLDLYRSQNQLSVDLYSNNKCEYQPPTGYPPLVKFLEDKHQAPVVITNGAKQAIGAVAYALNKMDKKRVALTRPVWPLIPPLLKAHGLETVDRSYDAYMAVLPNNPSGSMFDGMERIKTLVEWHKDNNVPFIHDGVYYNPIYLPTYKDFPALGDVQIYSMSKYLGLSGLRIGFAVCKNEQFYHDIQEYMEMMTVGVSTVSQSIVLELLTDLEQKETYNIFIQRCQEGLIENKTIIKSIRKDILDVPEDIVDQNGMFGWFKKGKEYEKLQYAKINVADGEGFGDASRVRINLAVSIDTIKEVVKRINNL